MLFDRTIVVSNSNRVSAYDELSECFLSFPFRGTSLSLEEFNNTRHTRAYYGVFHRQSGSEKPCENVRTA